MIEIRFVDHYASASGVDRKVAERDVVLTYILKMMKEDGIIENLAFKGGTYLRKVYFGKVGRFSEDLDFTLIGNNLTRFERQFNSFIKKAQKYGFTLSSNNVRKSWGKSFSSDIQYSHDWNKDTFKFQASLRENPVMEVVNQGIKDAVYFKYTEFGPFEVPCMQFEEIIAEKIRATYQRGTIRDVYDLYQLAIYPYDRDLVKRLAVIKFWNDESDYIPDTFPDKIEGMKIDFSEIEYLLKNQTHPREEEVKARIIANYSYIGELGEDLMKILRDAKKHREGALLKKICKRLRAHSVNTTMS
jgi:predicted nucleotidyltransferase component of viral defense system